MRNLILILLLVLFFAFIYLLMSRIDRILDRLRKGNLRMEQQRPDPDRKIHAYFRGYAGKCTSGRHLFCRSNG